jgi:hypothetical protein
MIYIYEIVRCKEARRGAVKHLEFPAEGDQRVTATREDNKSPAPQYHNVSYYYDPHGN